MGIPFSPHDGGRQAAGFKGKAGDCVVRAIAIAADLPYREVYDELRRRNEEFAQGRSRRAKKVAQKGSTPRNGNFRAVYDPYIRSLGFRWVATSTIGSGCKVHLRRDELPVDARLIVRVSKHVAAVVCGTLLDTHDCSRGGTRCVYGYYAKEPA